MMLATQEALKHLVRKGGSVINIRFSWPVLSLHRQR